MADQLNFTFQIQPPTDGGKWGFSYPNKSFAGLRGDIQVIYRQYLWVLHIIFITVAVWKD